MSTIQPYFRRRRRAPQRASDFSAAGDFVDLRAAHLDPYEVGDAVGKAQSQFDARAAACVSAGVAVDGWAVEPGGNGPVRVWPDVAWTPHGPRDPETTFWARDLLGVEWTDDDSVRPLHVMKPKCLPSMAYWDFFPDQYRVGGGLRTMVSAAVLAASPGWCGSFGPGLNGTADLASGKHSEGNYDMSQMFLLPLAYQFYQELSGPAREFLITKLLARGTIHRFNLDDTYTSGRPPVDWERAGYLSPDGAHTDVGETENHILMIAAARYLTNQLLYQRDHSIDFDNRRNANADGATCLSIVLDLLRSILRDDFSEYNSKPYQGESRRALLCLHAYAYDQEVRLAARMVLDYLSAHIAVSSNDLRRMVPFRRRNEGDYVGHDPAGFMTLRLLDAFHGADPMASCFAIQAGNTRAYQQTPLGEWQLRDSGSDLTMEALSEYRIPDSIHDLFVTDGHRQFYQKLHRTIRSDELGGNRNADNMEIYASSPSYLITAGGGTAGYAIDPYFVGLNVAPGDQRQQLGVSVTTSLMPTGHRPELVRPVAGTDPSLLEDAAATMIQFSAFAEGPAAATSSQEDAAKASNLTRNYGVAPDFACGHNLHLPSWVGGYTDSDFQFLDASPRPAARRSTSPGFFLVICSQRGLACLEALDTWLHPEVTFDDFKNHLSTYNESVQLRENEEFDWVTYNGNRIRAVIWSKPRPGSAFGAEIRSLNYAGEDPATGVNHAATDSDGFLNGTILNSPAEAVVTVTNPFLGTTITLDMKDKWRPRRVAENGDTEQAGPGRETWLDFEWPGPSEGDVCRPFNTVAAASAAVAPGGRIRILPGSSRSRATISATKPLRLVAPFGGVTLGANADATPAHDAPSADSLTKDDVWLQFDYPASSAAHVKGPHRTLSDAVAAVPDAGVIRIVPGEGTERSTIPAGKRVTLRAPIGGVRLGVRDWYGRYDNWRDIGGLAVPGVAVAAVARTVDTLDAFVIGYSGRVCTSSWSAGGDWSGVSTAWRDIGGQFTTSSVVTVLSRTSDTLDLFAVDGTGLVWTTSWSTGGDWSGSWQSLGGSVAVAGTVTAVARTPDNLDLFAVDGNRRVCTASWSLGNGWGPWRPIGGFFPFESVVAAVARTSQRLDLFITGSDGRIYTSSWSTAADWSGIADDWRPLGGRVRPGSAVTAVSRTPDDLQLFAAFPPPAGQQPPDPTRVYTSSWSTERDWTGDADWASIGGPVPVGAPIAAISRRPVRLDVFFTGDDGRVYSSYWSGDGGWSAGDGNWRSVGGFFPAAAPITALARTPDHMDLFVAGADGHIYNNWWPASH